jgi:hypothetical protein
LQAAWMRIEISKIIQKEFKRQANGIQKARSKRIAREQFFLKCGLNCVAC